MKYLLLFLSLWVTQANVFASDFKSKEAKVLAEKLKQSINRTMVKIVEYEKRAGVKEEQLSITIQQESGLQTSLGAVLDKDNRVLLITHDSQAESMGLLAGDIIQVFNINDQKIDATKDFKLKSGDELKLQVFRDNQSLVLVNKVTDTVVPAWQLRVFNDNQENTDNGNLSDSACGRVSVFFTPPETKRLYNTYFSKINEKNLLRSRESIKLTPGKHILYMHELIPFREIRYRKKSLNRAKPIEIEIEPNKTYYLAAKFDSKNRYKQRNEEYWDPVIWKVVDRKCEL